MRKYVYLSLFLYLTLARCGEKDLKRQKTSNVDSYETNEGNTSKPYQMTVDMKDDTDGTRLNIVIYHGCRNKEDVDDDYASYTAINCKSALWVVRKINDFISQNMLSVQSKFDEELLEFAANIWFYVDRFINTLLNFLEKLANSSFYMDKGVLKAFISLKIKISLMIYKSDCVETGFNKTQQEIIELLLVELVELQRYSSMHCDYTTVLTTEISEYFKVWVFVDGADEDSMIIDQFLIITTNAGLDSDGTLKTCDARQILLEKIVEIRGTDAISSTVLDMMSDEGGQDGDNPITIRRIADRMLVSCDVDVFSWYHDSVLAAIMKLLCHAALTSENALSDEAKIAIKRINEKIQAHKYVLPAYFAEGFGLLRDNVDTDQLKSYSDRLRVFHVQEPSTGLAGPLLERILEHFDKITCAEKYLKHLRGENDDKYYTPGSHNRRTLLADYWRTEKWGEATACEFVMRLYVHAVHHSDFIPRPDIKNMSRAIKTISEICVQAIQMERDNWHLVRTAYDVAVLLANLRLVSEDKRISRFLYERTMARVMSELNVYRTKYCRTGTHQYLAIPGYVIRNKDGRSLRIFMQRFFKARYDVVLPAANKSTSALIDAYGRYFQVDYLYDNYVVNSEVVKRYRDVVRVYWNRRLLSVDAIFKESTTATLDPRNVYALYDVYNKFFLAVVFHEARRALTGSDYRSLEAESAVLKTAFDFNDFRDVFPDGLAALKTDLSTIFSFPYTTDGTAAAAAAAVSGTSARDPVSTLRNAVSDAAVKFARSNVVFEDNAVEQPSTSNRTPLTDDTFLAMLHEDVNVLVRGFNIEFQQLRRFY